MSAEADFRRAFEAAIRRHIPLLAYMSSMNRAGVPDEYAIVDGRSYWIELKAVAKWPKRETSNVLAHRFSGPQLTFMRRVDAAGGRGLGVVGWQRDGAWRCVALRVHDIAGDGSLSRADLARARELTLDDWFHVRFLRLLRRA